MYLIVEGMPSFGKTTLAKALTDELGASYFKSLLPSDAFGNQVRKIRDGGYDDCNVHLLQIVDLFRKNHPPQTKHFSS